MISCLAKPRPRHTACVRSIPKPEVPDFRHRRPNVQGSRRCGMRSRVLVGALAIVGILAAGTIALRGAGITSSTQWAIVNLPNATRIAGSLVMGPVLVVHDDTKMAKGLPCTTMYRFEAGKGPTEELVAFHCKPRRGTAPDTFTFTRISGPAIDVPGGILTAYQFAGDPEIHGVPIGH